MDKECVSVGLSEYNFLTLFCAIMAKQKKGSIINKNGLERELYNYYSDPEVNALFEDICPCREFNNNHLELTEAFNFAYATGLLILVLDSSEDARSIIGLHQKEADAVISAYKSETVEKMNLLINKMYPEPAKVLIKK